MGNRVYPLIISGKRAETNDLMTVYDKTSGEVYANVHRAGEAEIERAIKEARAAVSQKKFPVLRRYEVLMKAAALLKERAEEFAEVMVAEAGKLRRDALNEVNWSLGVLTEAAEEAKRLHGEMFTLPIPGLEEKTCYTIRQPVGVVAAITPFNFPLNQVVHKVAPALAAGNAVVVKPAEQTPVTACLFGELLVDAGVPEGYLHVLNGEGDVVGERLLRHEGIDFYSFTGSAEVGEHIKKNSGLRRVTLELGSNSATIVHSDYDPHAAAAACCDSAFANAGQACISLQRIYVHESIFEPFLKRLIELTEALNVGDPRDEKTHIGPMISEEEAARLHSWVEEAVEQGAVAHTGNRREGAFLWPTVLSQVTPDMKVMRRETFGPVVSVVPYSDLKDAIAQVNDSEYGLQAGILTHQMSAALEAVQDIETGGVIVGGTCSFRIGTMPYGGIKNSGIGREGPRYAMEEMSNLKTVVILH